MVTNGNAGKIA